MEFENNFNPRMFEVTKQTISSVIVPLFNNRSFSPVDETVGSPVGGPTSSARSLSSQRNANASKQCMDCHEVLPNALALAQHKRKGSVSLSVQRRLDDGTWRHGFIFLASV